MYLKGDFQERGSVIEALRALQADGFRAADLDVFSAEPLELPHGVLDRRSHMSLTVVTGAVTLCLLTIGFVYFTQYNYPLTTGGMPIFSFWATGVIFYELTMLGGIVTTLACFLWESGM
ncbi:MAG TPA: quinol:electron acceptor oxidoreductase subunit ActD, partial [Bryobacteraceae bacterium]|nr:quinol:electron acceptor oxidoreductase subunit ActD [Bryobacteraceae bacterium]